MRISSFISRKYFFSRKNPTAINFITIISIIGYSVGSFALLVSLSALNGFEGVIFQVYENYYPDLKVSPTEGKYFEIDNKTISELNKIKNVKAVCRVIEDNAIARIDEKQLVGMVKGVDSNYANTVSIDSILLDGRAHHFRKGVPLVWLASGVYYQLQPGGQFNVLSLMTPRTESFSVAQMDMNELPISIGCIIDPGEELAQRLMVTPLSFAEELFEKYDMITGLEIGVNDKSELTATQLAVQKVLGKELDVKNRKQQNQAVYKMFVTEKVFVFFIMSFVLLLVSFNLLGALSMLVLEKKANIKTFKALGMKGMQIRNIFFNQAMLIAGIGTVIGIVIGIVLVIAQQRFGLLKVDSQYSQAYPVNLQLSDVWMVLALGLIMGLISAIYPTKKSTQ